jgi:hypothetical protein
MRAATTFGIVVLLTAPVAHAGGKICHVVGAWTDSYSSQITLTTNKRGTAIASVICGTATYKLKVTELTKTVWNLTATTKKNVCPALAIALTFEGGCTSASGTITFNGGQADDTWTKTGNAQH